METVDGQITSNKRRGRNSRRNGATLRILLGLFLIGLIFVLGILRKHGLPSLVAVLGLILLGTFGLLFYFQGCFAMARAKGYEDGVVLAGIVIGALCMPGLIFILPLLLAFCLKDKNQPRRSRSRR
jgi:hypothetical protein